MIAVIAEFTVDPQHTAQFEAIGAELADQVLSNEPEAHIYRIVRSQDDKNRYRIFELYTDQEALRAHSRSEHFRTAFPRITALLTTRPTINVFDAL